MKKTNLIPISIVLLMPALIFSGINKANVKEVDAYSISNLPTTINLNDNSASEIRNYYSSLNALSSSERQGTNLLKNLKTILAKDQKYYSYDNNTKIWQMYEITDRDWKKSPASSVTYGSYDATTNTITGYQYGTSNSDSKNNPYVHALYNNRDLDNQAKAWGDHNQNAWGINQEHIWAKSHGFDTEGSDSTGGARGDPMHLWAGNGWANHEHSNNFFAFVDKSKEYSDAGTKYKTSYGNLTGYSINAGGSEKVFEPQDSDKGDIARAIFYMAARYNYYSGKDSAPIDGNNPNLVILNNLSESDRTGTSSASSPYAMGLLSDLLAWNKLDPVDEYEIHRNNLLYNNYTNNRNPFIDFPDWADYIWGTANKDGKNYNPTVTGSADPSKDIINGAANSFRVSVTDILLQKDETIKVFGSNAEGNISWSVDDSSVVSLSKTTSVNNEEITVTALKNGNTTIHASTTIDSELIIRDIPVLVDNLIVSSLTLSNYKKDFKIKDTFTTDGLVVVANYTNGRSRTITTGYIVSTPDMTKEGKQTVTVTYQGITATYEINIVNPASQYLLYAVIAGAVIVVVIIVVIIFIKGNKKTKKKIKSTIKKSVKTFTKQSKKR